jgi:serine/threonine-protein kinase PpkA
MQIPGYKVEREIGRGGMATVYLATQESLNRHVVLKLLNEFNASDSDDLVERFMAEGRIIASLRHPNIITIYDIGIRDKLLYISMEYVEGGDLKRRMELPMSADEALDFLGKIAGALGEAHRHGVVHRDVKPANILFRDNETPLLTDFGIAKQVDTETNLTSTGIFLGSPNYVSPEQADGKKIDGRADIYSLGCIFYEMLSGRKPFVSDSVIDVVIQHKQAPIPRLPPEHAALQPLLDRMMAKKREDRFSDAEALVGEVQKIQRARRQITQLANLDSTTSIAMRTAREGRSKKILGGLMLLGLVGFSTLKYVEIRIKDTGVNPNAVTVQTTLQAAPPPLPGVAAPVPAPQPATDGNGTGAIATSATPPVATDGATVVDAGVPVAAPAPAPVAAPQPPEQVLQALQWLGRQSLEAYKLTYPPNDNAYYYFTRLLELDPGNQTAVGGILEIADRYAVLAEQAMARNENEKSAAYVDIGLRINPDNKALLALQDLVKNNDQSLVATLKSLFSGK